MRKKLGALLRWEFGRTYRFPILELVSATLVVQIAGFAEPSFYASGLASEVVFEGAFYAATILDLSLTVGMLFLVILVSLSIAEAFQEGEIRVLLSYPLSRVRILSTKVAVNFGVFFLIYAILLGSVLGVLTPAALWDPVFLVLLAGIGIYQFLFVSLATFVAVVSKSVKTSIIVLVICVLSIMFGLNSLILRAYTFLSSLFVTYGELRWEGFSFSSSVAVPFLPVLISYAALALLFLILAVLYFDRYVEA